MSMTPSILTSPALVRTQTQETILRALESTATEYRGLASPPSDVLLPPVFPCGRDSLGESSQSTRLEQGMREMSLVLEDMVEGSFRDRDSLWGLDPEGRRLVVGRPERNFDSNERFHGDPIHPEFYD